MRRRYVQIDGELVEVGDSSYESISMIQPDIQPYKSMVTGEMITSRSQHREHLKRHGLKEVGNEVKHLMRQPPRDTDPAGRKELIRAQVDSMNESQFKRALKRDIDFVKWNSRGL